MSEMMLDRYGTTSPARRRVIVLVSGVVGLVALGWLAWAAWFQSTPDVQSQLKSFTVVDAHEVSAEISVRLRSTDVRATCLLRAHGEDHTVVGERNLTVRDTPGTGTVSLTVPFRTEREATSVELVGCTTPDQHRPR